MLASVLLAFAACAVGVSDIDGQVDEIQEASGGYGGWDGEGGDYDDSSADTTTSSQGGWGQGGDAEVGAGGAAEGSGGADPGCDYTAPNACTSATLLSAIAGDKNTSVAATGVTSEWLKVHVKEEDGSIFETDLSYTVTLESPPGMDWDVYVLQGPQDGAPNCGASPMPGTGAGGEESVSNGWDDDQGFGGEDDSVWLCIEVRYVSGALCDDAAEWSLTVQGHT